MDTGAGWVVLIVDDDFCVRESIQLLLSSQASAQVLSADGFTQACDFLAAHHIDVLIADVLLAGLKSGIDLAHIAEQMQPNAAILIVSADARNEMANFPARAIFLQKPFGSEKLLHAIKQARAQVTAST
ncbi:response regulator [Rhodanobacter sp. C03]|uniref:response regulator n=1 Tax=Rhodanobacter sp. C03 TaxID=1945858 RepID=UPI0009CF8053|nr:response regulator [Rhodanobacter sp. C03]OOG59691.1 hypothetical protein B0E48_02505 [Rhodanobacter sp. C03]